MGQTLPNGIYLPAEGERNCYDGLEGNWRSLDSLISTVAGKASATHTHGNISNDGKVGTAANKPLITGTGGAVQAGSFGTAANTFCEGNDSRLSDARTPVAHTHAKSDVTNLFNSANTWTGNQTYSGVLSLSSFSDVAEQFKQKLPKDVSTSNDAMARANSLVDSAGHYVVVETLGHWSNYVAKNITLKYKNDATKQGAVEFRLYSDGSGIFYPQSPFGCDLGNIYNKWKTLNGINPGALSLPDKPGGSGTVNVNYFDLSGNVTVKDGSTYNSYTALCDGWIVIGSFASEISIEDDTTNLATTAVPKSNGYAQAYLPVRQGDTVRITINQTNTQYQNFKLIPCQGNV